jgi:hypothetical protein
MLIRRFLNLSLRSTLSPRHTAPISLPFRPVHISLRSLTTMSNEEKAITLPVLDESELKDGEMKQVEFGEGENKGKVLLVKIGGKVVSSLCFLEVVFVLNF